MKRSVSLIAMVLIAANVLSQSQLGYQMHVGLKDGTLHYPADDILEMKFHASSILSRQGAEESKTVTEHYAAISVDGLAAEFSKATETAGRSEAIVRMAGITMQAVGGTTPANDDDGYPCINANGEVWKWNAVNWDEKWQRDINFYYVLGTGNPYTSLKAEEIVTDGAGSGHYRAIYGYYKPDGSAGLPVSGLYYRFMPKYDGTLRIGIWSNKNSRNTFVVDESTCMPVSYQAEGYINGQNDASGKKRFLSSSEIAELHDAAGVGKHVIGTGNYFWGWITVEVKAGKTYLLFQDSSQIGFQEFTFTYVSDGENVTDDTADCMMAIFNKMGEADIRVDDIVQINFDKQQERQAESNPVLDEAVSPIPSSYDVKAESRGQVEGLNYRTVSYVDGKEVEKTAYVYLPWEYYYHPERRYNVLYLMHGMGDDATTYIYGNTKELRMALDHLIEKGKIKPMIVVAPTFYAPGAGNANINMAASSFPKELLNDLMPAVESKYRTYAASADAEGFKASRSHRAFGGFSMGSVTTWNVFKDCLPYIREFIPMSGGMTMTTGGGSVASQLAAVVSGYGLGEHDFYINAMSGSADYAAGGLSSQINEMSKRPPFILSRDKRAGNIFYREWPDGQHDYRACITYVYNALFNLFCE